MLASRLRTVASLALVVVVVAGCGSGGGPSKARYVSEADAICSAASAQTRPLVSDVSAAAALLSSGGTGGTKRLASDLRRLQKIASAYLARLERLRQPSGDHAAIERFLTPLASIVGSIGKAATAVASGQLPEALALLEQAAPVAQDVTRAAQAYGLQQCATVLPALG